MAKAAKASADPASVLPPLQPNKRYEAKQKYKAKLKARAEERERVARHGGRKQLERLEQRKRSKAGKKVTAKKVKTVIASAKTGQESLRKVQARELVRQRKRAAAARLQQRVEQQRRTRAQRNVAVKGEQDDGEDSKATATAATAAATRREDEERALLARVICGSGDKDSADDDDAAAAVSLGFVSPAAAAAAVAMGGGGGSSGLAFVDDYAATKRAEVVKQDALLRQAHVYFKGLAKKEKQLHKAAARRLRELKAINRRGGDKDGFRYIVPRNVKEMAEQMRAAQGGALFATTATAQPSSSSSSPSAAAESHLTSSFGGDDPVDVADKPMRRRRRRGSTFSDFYQFQVSRQWTRNAENFLRRGRAGRSLFEAKKHQRSIRKL